MNRVKLKQIGQDLGFANNSREFRTQAMDWVTLAYDSIAYDPVKTRLSESQAEAEEQTNHHPNASRLLATPTILFSLDHKRRSHKRNRNSAYDFVFFFIFTRP